MTTERAAHRRAPRRGPRYNPTTWQPRNRAQRRWVARYAPRGFSLRERALIRHYLGASTDPSRATGADLDHIAALYGVQRRQPVPADESAPCLAGMGEITYLYTDEASRDSIAAQFGVQRHPPTPQLSEPIYLPGVGDDSKRRAVLLAPPRVATCANCLGVLSCHFGCPEYVPTLAEEEPDVEPTSQPPDSGEFPVPEPWGPAR